MKRFIIILIISSIFFLPTTPALALGFGDAQGQLEEAGEKTGLPEGDPESFLAIIINALLSITGIIFLALMIYSGYLWMTAYGEKEKVDKAKDVMRAAIIGIIVVVLAYGITYFVITQLAGSYY